MKHTNVPKVLLDSANMSAMLLYIITSAVMFSYLTSEQYRRSSPTGCRKGPGRRDVPAVREHRAARGQRDGAVIDRADHSADPVSGGDGGIDPVHFGIMMTVNMEVGMCRRRWA
jgi:C4-dicarboxylate transporter DctM subunit